MWERSGRAGSKPACAPRGGEDKCLSRSGAVAGAVACVSDMVVRGPWCVCECVCVCVCVCVYVHSPTQTNRH